jgi:hypothetical protein
MAISKNTILVAFIATTMSFGICAEDQQPETPKTFDLAQSIKNTGNILTGSLENLNISYEELSKTINPYCNLTSITVIGLSGVCLKFRSFAALTTGFLLAIYSKNISEVIEKKIAPSTIENNQDSKLELEKTNPAIIASVNQGQNNSSDQKTE